METKRFPVRWFSTNDLSMAWYLPEALKLTKALDPNQQRYTLNKILELYNVSFFITSEISLPSWTEAEKTTFFSSKTVIELIIQNYFKSIDQRNFTRRTAKLFSIYQKDFLALYVKYNLSNAIPEKQFIQMVESTKIPLWSLLQNQYIVNKYQDYLKNKMLSSVINAEVLLDVYVVDNQRKPKLNMPRNISKNEKESLIERYIDSETPNPNYLHQILNVRNSENFKISAEIQLKAKKKLSIAKKNMFANPSTVIFDQECIITMNQNQEEDVITQQQEDGSKHSIRYTYSGKKLMENIADKRILLIYNFIHRFKDIFVNKDSMGIDLISKTSELGFFERYLSIKSKGIYQTGMAFNQKERIAQCTLYFYRRFLDKNCNGETLESLIEWFYSDYIRQEFNICDFRIQMPPKGTTYLQKCNLAVITLESIAHQYNQYAQNREIDHELLTISTQSISYCSISSQIEHKYVYAVKDNKDIQTMLHYLFSDQAGLGYVNENLSKPTLAELLSNNPKPKYDDFADYQKDNLKYLIKHSLLKNTQGIISFDNAAKLAILTDIYQNGFIAYTKKDADEQKEINSMMDDGCLEFADKNTLLSFQEANYFNYYLNNRFTNGLALRNIYVHGKPANLQEKDHEGNYITVMNLLVLLTIKINDELCNIADAS